MALSAAEASSVVLTTPLILDIHAATAHLGEVLKLRAQFANFPMAADGMVLVMDDGDGDTQQRKLFDHALPVFGGQVTLAAVTGIVEFRGLPVEVRNDALGNRVAAFGSREDDKVV